MSQRTTAIGHQPRLFVRRVALYESFSPGARIREVEFKCGLNLIVGEHAASGQNDLGGHSVGKTTLCRLIRHCLGEATFATEDDQQAIRDNFPSGWVGCEVDIDGTPWAVLLPFTRTAKDTPLAASDETLVSLFDLEKKDNQYQQYNETLASLRPPQASFPWTHLLAWLARDQDCIQGSYWEWRVGSSQSGTKLPRAHEDRALLVRSVIGLKPETEDALREELERIKHLIECADTEKTTIEQNLHDQLRHALRILREHVDFALPEPKAGELLPSLLMNTFFKKLEGEIEQAEAEHLSARQALLTNALSIKKHLDLLKKNEAILTHKKESIAARENLDASASSELKELLAALEADPMCPANKLISECDHVQSLKETYEQKEAQKNGKRIEFSSHIEEREFKQRCEEVELIERQYAADKAALDELLQYEATNKESEKELYKKYTAKCRKQEWLKELWDTFQSAWSFLHLGAKNEATEDIVQSLSELNEEKNTNEWQFSQLRTEIEARSKNIETLFSKVTQKATSDACTGKVTIAEAKFDFDIINHAKRLDKGAMKVLSIIIGDITCMLSSIHEAHYHPGLLVHDSPRNAELDRAMYMKVLEYLIEHAQEYSKDGHAPFQYIASMTEKTAEELASYVRVRLASDPVDKLLFKNKLIPREQSLL